MILAPKILEMECGLFKKKKMGEERSSRGEWKKKNEILVAHDSLTTREPFTTYLYVSNENYVCPLTPTNCHQDKLMQKEREKKKKQPTLSLWVASKSLFKINLSKQIYVTVYFTI